MTKIQTTTALETLDSHGNPTVIVRVALNNGITASACVPSGASTGIREAVELRDGDRHRYGGKSGSLNRTALGISLVFLFSDRSFGIAAAARHW